MAERIVEVEWEDTACTHGWHEDVDLPETWTVYSVGYVQRDDERGIRLTEARASVPAGHKRGTRDFGCSSMIPRTAIRKVRELKRG